MKARPIEIINVSQPSEEPLTLQEVKEHCRITETTEDALISAHLIPAARAQCELFIGCPIIERTIKAYYSSFGDEGILILPWKTKSVASVTYLDGVEAEQTLDAATYEWINDKLHRKSNKTWPTPFKSVRAITVNAVQGFGTKNDIPQDLALGMKNLIDIYFNFRSEKSDISIYSIDANTQWELWGAYRTGRL